MRGLRDTEARLRGKVKYLGVEGGVLPLVITGAVSAILITIASQSGSILDACLGALPFVLTFCYMLIFVTGRRPHFSKDLVCHALIGKSLSPLPPDKQPQNPATRA
jgi:hypothetical protein